jgi:hypothetical protein
MQLFYFHLRLLSFLASQLQAPQSTYSELLQSTSFQQTNNNNNKTENKTPKKKTKEEEEEEEERGGGGD